MEIAEHALAEIEALLGARLGFDTRTVGAGVVASVVHRCARDAGVPDLSAYARLLAIDPGAWERLVDRALVPETWFFRDAAPFDFAARLASAHAARFPGRTFRALSCPCSTGEEPYSMAMALVDAGIPPATIAIDGVDVRRSALTAAREGAFRARAFRNDHHGFRERHFDHRGGLWHVKPAVKALVRFRQGNLVSPEFLAAETPYDVVFCRNLLIYLHKDARRAVMANLRRLLADDGVLLVGHAETGVAWEYGLRATGPAGAFACAHPRAATTARATTPPPAAPPRISPPGGRVPHTAGPAKPVPAAAPANAGPEPSLLARAGKLADAGQLEEATRLCRGHLQRSPDSAEGHFLMGVLHDATSDAGRAEQCFRRTLYLDPAHAGALLRLALMRERSGDRAGAALLRARASRAMTGKTDE